MLIDNILEKHMRKYLIAGILLLFTLSSCTQYILIPIPGGNGSDNNKPSEETGDIWDGTPDSDWFDPEQESGTYQIATAEQLAGLAELVNSGEENFEGKTVVLVDDINLDNKLWTPIGLNGDELSKTFKGTFDGNGKTIRNLRIEQEAAYHAAGLFGSLNGGTVKNLTIDGAEITSISAPNKDGNTINGTAVLAGSLYLYGKVENVKVYNFSVSGNRYVGAIAGYSTAGNGTEIRGCVVEDGSLTATPDNLTGSYDNGDKVGGIIGYCVVGDIVEGCEVNNVSLKGYRDVGGVIGYRDTSKDGDNPVIVNNKVSNINITIDGTNGYKSDYDSEDDYSAGDIIGDTAGGAVDSSNTSSNCDIKYTNVNF